MKTLQELSGKRVLFRHAQSRELGEGTVREFAGDNKEYVRMDYQWFDAGLLTPLVELSRGEPDPTPADMERPQQQQQQQQDPNALGQPLEKPQGEQP